MKPSHILAQYAHDWGIHFPEDVTAFTEESWKNDYTIAMDAQPQLVTTPNAGIPWYLANIMDPNVLRILTAKNKAVEIFGEVRKGDWTSDTVQFPVIEQAGDVSSYGDWNTQGRAGANTNFPQRQSYLYQVITQYGERELDREALAKINWATETRNAAITVLNKFQNLTYFRGVSGLQNYGLQTDPNLPAPIAPGLKAWGGVGWWNGNIQAATANEIFSDIQALFGQLVTQSSGNIEADTEMVLALSPKSGAALTATNSFNVNVKTLIKENFPNLKIVTAIQYGVVSTQNPQGIAGGELAQLIATNVEGQETGYCAFNEKLRAHSVIKDLSSFKQKMTQGSFGAVIRQPFAIAQMLGL